VSRRICLALGTKLPDNRSCGDPCSEFPFCLPPLPDSTATGLATLLANGELERERAQFLTDLCAAIADVGEGDDDEP
jgi:hypothetical protein